MRAAFLIIYEREQETEAMSRLIPPIVSEDLIEAVSSLTRSAHAIRSVLLAEADPKVFDLILNFFINATCRIFWPD
jgi:hypothetical protein